MRNTLTAPAPQANSTATGLIRYDAACHALAEASRVDEVKDIRDKAVAMQHYARQAQDSTLIKQATQIRLRAERRAGELLIEMKKRGERREHSQRSRGETSETLPPKLSDLGINKTQSSRWQRLAALDQDHFEAKVEAASTRGYDMMTRRFIKADEIEELKARPGSRRPSPGDIALFAFTERVCDLIRRIAKHHPGRFVTTAVESGDLAKLGAFFTALAELKNSYASVEQSAEEMKVKHAALDGAESS